MIECCKGGICYICTEDKWLNDYKPLGFKIVEPEKSVPIEEPIEEPVEEVVETPVVTSTPKPRGRKK